MTDESKKIQYQKEKWEEEISKGKTLPSIQTDSGIPLKPIYSPLDLEGWTFNNDLNFSGFFPFTRGVYPSMYLGQPWTIRQYAGLGTADATNKRFRFLLDHGQTGLSVALDLPTQLGYDSDDPLAEEEVGVVGVAIDTIEDMETIFKGIPLDKISVHFTINAPAIVIFAMYLIVAERRGIPFKALSGTLQNDILKEYIARNAYIFPPQPSLRLIGDIIDYCQLNVPKFNPISITGYHAREAGASAVQEIAYTLSAGIAYVETMLARGMDVDLFAPRLSFHFSMQRDLFEEICKIRAARRLWAKIIRDRFGSNNPRSQMLRFFNGGSGASLTYDEPLNNIIRGTLQCLAGVLGGAQACHVPSYDEAYSIPSEESALISLRIQQILAHESGITNVIDPLGGSYYIEALTNQLEKESMELIEKIDTSGGYIALIEKGTIRNSIIDRAFELQKKLESGERIFVGMNAFIMENNPQTENEQKLTENNKKALKQQQLRLKAIKSKRNNEKVTNALEMLKLNLSQQANLMPFILEAVRNQATLGEIIGVMKSTYGEYSQQTTR